MADNQTTPKIQVDSDWKAEAQREKERLAKKDQAKKEQSKSKPSADVGAEGEGRGAQELPEANFRSLVGMLASQAIMGLGAMADPQTNRVIVDLEGSRFAIDLLDLLEQKTKGNLTDEEAKELRQILAELRSRYVQIANFVARQMAAQPGPGGVAIPGEASGVPGAVVAPD
jgi:hypothetical protein